jgi:hypothetical protein
LSALVDNPLRIRNGHAVVCGYRDGGGIVPLIPTGRYDKRVARESCGYRQHQAVSFLITVLLVFADFECDPPEDGRVIRSAFDPCRATAVQKNRGALRARTKKKGLSHNGLAPRVHVFEMMTSTRRFC